MKNKWKQNLTAAALVTLGGFLLYENNGIEVDEYTVSSPDIPAGFDGFRILQLSDFHNKSFGFENRYLLHKIHQTHPDIILMTGDMVSREDITLDTFYRLCKALGKEYRVYYTVGNHELDLNSADLHEMFSRLKRYGIRILNNERVTLRRGGSALDLYGMWYDLRFYKDKRGNYRHPEKFDCDEMHRLLGRKRPDTYSILMAHNPLDFDVYAAWGADLTFSGHVHGGVVRLGRYGGLFSPGRRLFPKYYAGVYVQDGKKLLVSRGIGGPRLFNRPNLLVATLKSRTASPSPPPAQP